MRLGGPDRPGQHGETPEKLAKCDGACLVVPATWEAEAEELFETGGRDCSEPRWHHCTPAQATEEDSVSKKKTEKN